MLKRSFNTKARARAHTQDILTELSPSPPPHRLNFSREYFNLQNKSESRYICMSAGPYVFNPPSPFFPLSILSLFCLFPQLTVGSNLLGPPRDHVWCWLISATISQRYVATVQGKLIEVGRSLNHILMEFSSGETDHLGVACVSNYGIVDWQVCLISRMYQDGLMLIKIFPTSNLKIRLNLITFKVSCNITTFMLSKI